MATTRKTQSKHSKDDEQVEARPLAEIELPQNEDVVAVVTRDEDGNPKQSDGFVVLLPEGATDEEKAAAWNLGGELPPEDRIVYYRPGR